MTGRQGEPEEGALKRIVSWARDRQDIRALVLTSSRTNPRAEVDWLSDYDLVIAVDNPEQYKSADWLVEAYGPVLIGFDPAPPAQAAGQFSRLAIYGDGTKLDWSVWAIGALSVALHAPRLPRSFDVGYEFLIDLDGLAETAPPATYTAHVPIPPTAEEYGAVVNEFWWETSYVGKYLWRGELMPARYSFDVVIRHDLLRRMLEWHVEAKHGWSLARGGNGRYLAGRLAGPTRAKLEDTFATAAVIDNWRSLWSAVDLFRRVARDLAFALGYSYPDDLDRRMTDCVRRIEAFPPRTRAGA